MLNEHWLTLATYVCDVPEKPRAKAALFDLMMHLNDEALLVKYLSRENAVNLELQYRAQHLDAEVVDGLMGLLLKHANGDFPRIVRVLADDEVLERLGKQFEAPGEGSPE